MGWIFPDIVSITQGFKEYGAFFMLSLGATALLLWVAYRRLKTYLTEIHTVHYQVSAGFKSILDPNNPNRVIARAELRDAIRSLEDPDSRICVHCPEMEVIREEIFRFTSEGRTAREETKAIFRQMSDVNTRMTDALFSLVQKWIDRPTNGIK